MNIINHHPTSLDFKKFVKPDAFASIDDNDTIDGISDATRFAWFESVYDSIMNGGRIENANGEDMKEEIVTAMSMEEFDLDNERLITEFYERTLPYKPSYATSFITDNIVATQYSLELMKNPDPELSIWLLPSDVSQIAVNTANKQRSDVVTYQSADMAQAASLVSKHNDLRPLTVAITALYHPEALCINIRDDADWKSLSTAMLAKANAMKAMGIIDDLTLLVLNQVFQAKMESKTLTLAVALRSNTTPNTGVGSFGRVLMELLQSERDRFMPTSLRNFWYPRNIIFVNDYAHEHATPREIDDEWRHIMRECSKKSRPVAINELRKLDKSHNGSTEKSCGHDRGVNATQIDFKSGVPKVPQMYKRIKKIVEKVSIDAISAHPFVDKRATFARASRTRPDDFNKKGTVKKVNYYKDLHLYCDCSGSVSFENLQNTIVASIKVAKKLDLDLYLTTWGSSISQTTKVPIMNHTDKQIINFIVNLPMCGGGTNPELVWDRCEETKKRRDEVAIMITDFCFSTPRRHAMPKNLFYMPLIPTRGRMDEYQWICQGATSFMQSMAKMYSVPVEKVRKRFLF